MTETTNTETKAPKATLKQVTDFFRDKSQSLKDWTAEWKTLSDEDKEQIQQGIGDGSLTY